MTWYAVLKVVHVLSIILWMGGSAALLMVLLGVVATGDRAALRALLPQITKVMRVLGGPALLLLLLSGIAMVLVGGLTFKPLWIGLGFLGIIILGAFGGMVMSRRMARLETAATAGDDAAIAVAGAAVRRAVVIMLTIMAAIVIDMVLKPTR